MNLYHYCSNSVLLSILSKRAIWASEFSLSNDVMEGRWIREVFSQYCTEKGVATSDKEQLVRHLDSIISFGGATGFCMSEDGDLLSQWRGYADDGCGVSVGFSREYFEALGVLKRDRQDQFNASLTKVEYDVRRQRDMLVEHADVILKLVSEGVFQPPTLLTLDDAKERRRLASLRSLRLRFFLFFFYLYQFKNPAFAEEREMAIDISYLACRW